MIFDSLNMNKLLTKYKDQPDYDVPEIVYLGRSDKMAADREYLEELVQTAPLSAAKRSDWINRLLKEDYSQYKPAWFEIMIYGWLRAIGAVQVNPTLEGNDPDFVLEHGSQRIVIEAYTLLEYEEERAWQQRVGELMGVLEEIEIPVFLRADDYQIGGPLDKESLKQEVTRWLGSSPLSPLQFRDERGNSVSLEVAASTSGTRVGVFGPGRSMMVSKEPLKAPLRAKASQHKAIRKAGYPYVIAILLDPWQLSAESVAEAWLGQTIYKWDPEGKDEGELVADVRSGLHVFGSEVRHTSVSGTLVFRAMRNRSLDRNVLDGWYIENPYAKVPLDAGMFPVVASYEIIERGERSFSMNWHKRDENNN